MKKLLAAALAAACAAPAFAAPITYTLDPNHSQVRFGWNHYGFSNIEARFDKVSGSFTYDPENVAASSVQASIDVGSIDSGVDDLDDDLKSSKFFDATQFGTATYKSTAVRETGAGKLQVDGELTVHGVTRPVSLQVTVNKIGPHAKSMKPSAGFDATATLKRSDFGIGLYTQNVSDEVRIEITVEATDSKVAKPVQ
jgi:polyisoprenoid-binding protein YceI